MQIETDGILFDSDGVLVDSHALGIEAWGRMAEEFDLDIEVLVTQLAGVRAADTIARHLDGERATRAVDRLEDLEVELAGPTLAVPGAVDLLRALPDDGWTIVTSATLRLALARWRAAGIPVPPRVVTAEDVARGKPDPEPFLAGAAALGLAPERCIVFEDSPSGGLAAKAAGARVVAVGDQDWPFEPAARVEDLRRVSLNETNRRPLVLELN